MRHVARVSRCRFAGLLFALQGLFTGPAPVPDSRKDPELGHFAELCQLLQTGAMHVRLREELVWGAAIAAERRARANSSKPRIASKPVGPPRTEAASAMLWNRARAKEQECAISPPKETIGSTSLLLSWPGLTCFGLRAGGGQQRRLPKVARGDYSGEKLTGHLDQVAFTNGNVEYIIQCMYVVK